MKRYKQLVTICGVLLAVSMFAVGGVSAENASDYPPVDVNTTVEVYDGNDSLNSTVELDHARGYDSEALAGWDCSIGDCSSSNLSAFAGSGSLEVVSKNNMDISRNADGWEFTANGSSPSVVVEADGYNFSGGAAFGIKSSVGEFSPIKDGSRSGFNSNMANPGTLLTSYANNTHAEFYENGSTSLAGIQPAPVKSSNLSGIAIRATSNATLSGISLWDRSVSSGAASLHHDEYRLGAFVPEETTTTGQTLPEKASVTWDVNRLRDAETTLKVQSYDGSDWITEETLTVDNVAEYDIGVDGGDEYRFVSEPNSTVDSGGGGYFFGGGGAVLNIFGFQINQGNFMLGSGAALLLGVLAFFYPGMQLFGRTED